MSVKGILPIGAVLLSAVSLQAQLSFSGSYAEDFDGMGSAGTVLPEGWSAFRAGGSGETGVALTPGVTAGATSSGGVYNVGLTGDTDRALGTLASGSTVPAFGVRLLNATGALINQLTLDAVMEQWRTGSSATIAETVLFEYSLNASGLGDDLATWVAWPALNLEEQLLTSTSAGAVDGTAPENQRLMHGELAGLAWTPDDVLTLRWSDADHTSSDGLYAIDDLSIQAPITAVPEPAGLGTFALGLGALAALRRRCRNTASAGAASGPKHA